MTDHLVALGLDPGFASFGYAVALLYPNGIELAELGVIRTKKASGKVLQRDDDHRRVSEIVRALLAVTRKHRPDVICAEALSLGGGGATQRMQISTFARMGRVWGVVDTIAEAAEVALIQHSPQTIKKRTVGRNSASKLEVRAALNEMFDGAVESALSGIRARSQHEHPVDALGAIVASLDTTEVRIARAALARANRSGQLNLTHERGVECL